MLTNPGHLDTTVDAVRFSAGNAALRLHETPRPNVLTASDYTLQGVVRTRVDTSFAGKRWLIGTPFIKRAADRKSDLRRKVLSYQAERPHDPSVAKAVNDALKFIDLIPATATLPYVALAEDGEVNFYWRRRKSLLIDVGFVGDGMMHYYVWDEAHRVDEDASIRFSGRSLPLNVVKTLPLLPGLFGTDAHG